MGSRVRVRVQVGICRSVVVYLILMLLGQITAIINIERKTCKHKEPGNAKTELNLTLN